jgi:hypothetical protein
VRRGRVDETKAAADEHTEVDAVAKGGDERGLGEGFGGVGDPKIGAEDRDEALDDDPLGPKMMKQLVAHQPKRGATATKTGWEAPNRRGRRIRPRTAPRRGRRGSLDFFFFNMRSAREEGNVDNAVCDDGGGIFMVHRCGLKNLLMVKVRALEILKLRTTRKNPTKDRPTPTLVYVSYVIVRKKTTIHNSAHNTVITMTKCGTRGQLYVTLLKSYIS